MRQQDVLMTLRAGGPMTIVQILDALLLDHTLGNKNELNVLLQKLRAKRQVRIIGRAEMNRYLWEAVE